MAPFALLPLWHWHPYGTPTTVAGTGWIWAVEDDTNRWAEPPRSYCSFSRLLFLASFPGSQVLPFLCTPHIFQRARDKGQTQDSKDTQRETLHPGRKKGGHVLLVLLISTAKATSSWSSSSCKPSSSSRPSPVKSVVSQSVSFSLYSAFYTALPTSSAVSVLLSSHRHLNSPQVGVTVNATGRLSPTSSLTSANNNLSSQLFLKKNHFFFCWFAVVRLPLHPTRE